MPATLKPAVKSVVLRPDDEIKETLRRRNIGRPCPHCHMPLTMGKYVTGDRRLTYPQFAYYQCKGYRDRDSGQSYAGCGGSSKMRVMTEAEQLALLRAGRYAELEDYLRSIDRTSAQKKLDEMAEEHLTRLTAGKDGSTLAGADSAESVLSEEPHYEIDGGKDKRRKR